MTTPVHADAGRTDGFETAMNSGAVIVDNASERLYAIGELEGDRCDCGAAIPGDVDQCDDCRHCSRCDGDGCDWHLSPTNGAIEIDCACPTCEGTGRTPR